MVEKLNGQSKLSRVIGVTGVTELGVNEKRAGLLVYIRNVLHSMLLVKTDMLAK